jgi:hypothetical protein
MARAYLRVDPGLYDRKVIDQKYPPGAFAALVGALCHAEHQPQRGRFRDERVLRALLGPLSKWIPYLIEKRDLVKVKGLLYVDGWDEWQEGDWKVGERVRRIRNRQKAGGEGGPVTPDVTPDVTVDVTVGTESDDSVRTVYNLSDGGRQSVIDSGGVSGGGGDSAEPSRVPGDSPQPPASGGRSSRANGTNPRAIASKTTEAKRARRRQRDIAYRRGALTEAERDEMNERDAPLDEISDWAEHQQRLEEEARPTVEFVMP